MISHLHQDVHLAYGSLYPPLFNLPPQSLMGFSYVNTLVILMLRTIALYPTSKKRDWAVFYIILAIFTVNLALVIWLPLNVRGGRVASQASRCVFTQEKGDTALRAFLISAVAFDGECRSSQWEIQNTPAFTHTYLPLTPPLLHSHCPRFNHL